MNRFAGNDAALLPVPPPEFRQWVGNADLERYLTVGRAFFEFFVQECDLKEDHSVLDIGCGSGRMARFLLPYLDERGSYTGFDVWRDGIAWCRENLERKFRCARFETADVRNIYINRDGETENSEWPFPCPDSGIDFVFATSVFTHIDHEVAVHYLNEIRRVLSSRGKAVLTFFVVDRQALDFMSGADAYSEVSRDGPLYSGAPGKDVFVGWDPVELKVRLDRAGLRVLDYRPGYWCGRPPNGTVHFQDIYVVEAA